MITIALHGTPMGKERVRVTRSGGVFTPERTVRYEGRLALEAQRAMGRRPLFEGPLVVDVVAVMPIAESKPKKWKEAARRCEIVPVKKPDWDNFGKILDALNMVVWVDDAQIFRGSVEKFFGDKPMLAVRVRHAKPDDQILPEWVAGLQPEQQPTEGIFG